MIAAGLCAAWPLCIAASNAGISPTSVELDATRKVETISVSNPGTSALAFEVTVKRWRLDADGQWLLDDISGATNLVVHPLSFRVAPGKVQLIRVGTSGPEPGPEQAYRVFIREQPPTDAPAQSRNLVLLTQFSVPLFISTQRSKAEPSVLPGAFSDGRWRYLMQSGEHGHLRPVKATLRMLDASGRVLSTQQVSQGYVLAGSAVPVDATVDRKTCQHASSFELVAPPPLGTLKGVLPSGARACGP